MKLLRFGEKGQEKPGILDRDNQIRDISSIVSDINAKTISDIVEKLKNIDINSLPIVSGDVRLGSCVDITGKFICIAYNSRLHTAQLGAKLMPEGEVEVFLKANSSAGGANDDILYTRITKKLDWEAELGVVIGKQGKYIDKAQANDYILGYTCSNDISDRYWQFETVDNQYTKCKGFDGFGTFGPYLVTKDEVSNVCDLAVKLWVNEDLRQDFNTNDYIQEPEAVVSYVSQFFTLYPGDVISMGSAPGNAAFWGDDKFLKPGDKVIFEIESLGRQEQLVVNE